MSVGIYENGAFNKVAGNAKEGSATNTTYVNTTSGLQANNVQGAIDEVDNKVDVINDYLSKKVAVVSGTTSSSTGAAIVSASYPSGFNINNCMVIASMVYHDNIWDLASNHTYGQLRQNYLTMYTDGSSWARSCPFKIVVMRTDI